MNEILINIDRTCVDMLDRCELSQDERGLFTRASLCALLARLNDSQGDEAGAREMMAELLSMRAKLQSTSERLRSLSASVKAVDFLIYSLVKADTCTDSAQCDEDASCDT